MAYSQPRGSTPSTSASFRTSELEEAARALTRRIQRPEPIAHIYPADDPKLEQVLSKLRVSLRKRTATAASAASRVTSASSTATATARSTRRSSSRSAP